jgi:acyl-coenzyme A synthetase/AMP-(fatty) acid ligase
MPQHVEFVVELPQTASGKIRKSDLRNRLLRIEETTT